jgi:hypothetical protein
MKTKVLLVPSTNDDSRPQWHMLNEIKSYSFPSMCRLPFVENPLDQKFHTQRHCESFFHKTELIVGWSDMVRPIIETVLKEIRDKGSNVTVFWMDGFTPAIFSVKSILDAMNVSRERVKHVCFFHGSPNIPEDSFMHAKYLQVLDFHIWSQYDQIFIAREYLKKYLPDAPKKVCLDWLPLDRKLFNQTPLMPDDRDPVVVFPHRWCYTKARYDFIRQCLENKRRGLILTPVPIPKAQIWNGTKTQCDKIFKLVEIRLCTRETYLASLARSKWIFNESEYETFGIATVEGMALGCELLPLPDCKVKLVPEAVTLLHEERLDIETAQVRQRKCLKLIGDSVRDLWGYHGHG